MSKGRYTDRGIYESPGGAAGASLAQGTIAGRGSASGAGVYEQITAGANLSFAGTTLNASGGVGGGTSIADEDSYFFMPHGMYLSGITSLLLTPSARVFVCRTWIPFEFKFDQLIFRIIIAGTVDAIALVGLYSNDGNTLLATSGAVAAIAAGEKVATLGADVVIPAGFYLLAIGSEGTANLPYAQSITAQAQLWGGHNTACANGMVGYAANPIVGSALPVALGAITTTTNSIPWTILGGSA